MSSLPRRLHIQVAAPHVLPSVLWVLEHPRTLEDLSDPDVPPGVLYLLGRDMLTYALDRVSFNPSGRHMIGRRWRLDPAAIMLEQLRQAGDKRLALPNARLGQILGQDRRTVFLARTRGTKAMQVLRELSASVDA